MPILKTFGRNPSRKFVDTIKTSPNYKGGAFQNLSHTDSLAKGASYFKIMWRFFNKPANTAPPKPLPSIKTDLIDLKSDKPVIVWFGHSSYLIKVKGFNILVDPVFSGYASPFSFTGKCFKGSDVYKVEDFPPIDLLVLTHDHYDHLDYGTVKKLQPKTKAIATPTGVGSHLRYWGIAAEKIIEFDWWESREVAAGLELTATPARHFSGRSFVRNKTLWSSFVLKSGGFTIYIGSDSGYDSHFKAIGEKFGPFDIAILECGQYNEWWPFIHMMPEETVQAAIDLKANLLMPVHWGKFALGLHPWDEPIRRVLARAKEMGVKYTTPMIGEPVIPGESVPVGEWWVEY